MEVFLYCRGMLVLISLSSIRSSRINKDLNKEFLEDIKSLNKTGNFRHTKTSTGLTLSDSRNKTVRTWGEIKGSMRKSDSRNYTHAEIQTEWEPVTKPEDFNEQSLDRKHNLPTEKHGHTEQLETSLIPLNRTYLIRVTEGKELFGSESKKEVTAHTDHDQNKNVENKNDENKDARLTESMFVEDQPPKEEEINHEHPYTEKSADERKRTEEEIKPGDKAMMSFDHGTAKKTLQNTTERSVENNMKPVNSISPMTHKNDTIHMREKNLNEAVFHVKSTSKPRPKFQYTDITSFITKYTHLRKQEVKEEMNKTSNSNISTKPLISNQDRSQNKSVKTNMPKHEQNIVFSNISLQPKTRTEPVASQVQEAKEVNITSELKSDEDNKKMILTAKTFKTTIASKKINTALSSVKATKDLKTRGVALLTKSYSTTKSTKVITKISKQIQLAKTQQTNLLYENNLAENEKNMPDDPSQCAVDPSKKYTGSALVAAAVGGVIIGAFVVLFLFHLKQRCRNYINGDYRRVPMEYDFELNPRFKSH